MTVVGQAEKQLNIEKVVQGGLTWLNVVHPTQAEMQYLREHYDFHPLALDDCLSRIQVPKVDEYGNYLFVVLHFPLFNEEQRLTTASEVDIFVGADYVITVHEGELRPLNKLFEDCKNSEVVRASVMGRSSGYLLYRILKGLVAYCIPILNKLVEQVEHLQTVIFDLRARDLLRELAVVRRDILSYRRIVRPSIDVTAFLERKQYPFLSVSPDVYFGDLADNLRHVWTELEELKEVIEGLYDTHISRTTIRTNEIIRILTVLFTATLPGALIASIYGMNVSLPLEKSSYAFAVLMLVAGGITGGLLLLMRRWRWF